MGLLRNLDVEEILGQVFAAKREAATAGLPPLANAVFMGMGEPADNADAVRQGKVFGRVSRLAAGSAGEDIVVPGVCVYSRRSSALAAYMMSYDIYTIYPDLDRLTLVLGSGLNDLYRFGAIEEKDAGEAAAWEAAKAKAGGVHFLAVAPNQNSDRIDGFWLMQERDLPCF